ncbi:MAG: prepilin-type N-terminal cleavage/methylation domain-containing protein [Patescibacteria group bacterium]|jgi:prepilin-type N-terminal cleavage/methylation domain-containing protein|nr:prepilin-type N-terminal cleavage/methylation domain-containing protein [Patescibacteria group bacterium]
MSHKNRYNKKGFTLVELMVAMSIFVIVTTLAVGGFVAVNNLKALAMTQKETQQKIRISLELLTRYAKQAEFVKVSSTTAYDESATAKGVSGNIVEFYFNLSNYDNNGNIELVKNYRRGVKFEIAGPELKYYECTTLVISGPIPSCSAWRGGNNILGSEIKLRSSATFAGAQNPQNTTESRFTMNKEATDLINSPATDQDTFSPPTLTIKLLGDIGSTLSNQYYKDSFELETRVILSRLKW